MQKTSLYKPLLFGIMAVIAMLVVACQSQPADSRAETANEAEAAAPAAESGQQSLIIATASTGGTYYPVGVALSTLTNVKLANSGIQMNAISSAGSGENIQLLKNKEVDLAILQGLFGAMAWQGRGRYDGTPEQDMRAITMLWENVEHFVVDAAYVTNGNIADLENLKGQSFSIGRRGSGTETSGNTILQAVGFDPENDFVPERIGYSESSSALQDGRIAGMNIPAGSPVSAVTQAFATMGADSIAIPEFTDDQIVQVNSDFPVWSRHVIPANTYPGQEVDVNTISQPNFLAVHPDIDEETIYQITKTIYENLDFLVNIHQATAAMNLERAIVGLPIPLHPGAARYYEEVGIEIPESLLASN